MQPSPPQVSATAEDAVLGTFMALGRRMRARLPGDTLDFSALPILKALSTCGALRLTALAGSLELDASTVSRHVKQLEDRGFLERASDPDDGRASRITLSDTGRAALEAHYDRRRSLLTTALADWSDADRETLRTSLDHLHAEMSKA